MSHKKTGVFLVLFLVSLYSVFAAVVSHEASEINPGSLATGDYIVTGTLNATDDICIVSGNCLSSVSGGESNWNVSGTNLYPKNLNYQVGIGTNNTHSYPFWIKSTVMGAMTIASETTAGNPGIRLATGLSNENYWDMYTFGTIANKGLFIRYNGDDKIQITKEGNVGIGITSPWVNNATQKLHVEGNANITGDLSVIGNITIGTGTILLDGQRSNIELSPVDPVKIGEALLNSTALEVFVAGKYAYVGTSNSSKDVEIFDISNPTDISIVGYADLTNSVNGIYVLNKYMYTISNDLGGDDFEIFDISNKSNPVKVAGVELGANGDEIYVSGRYAYIGTDGSNEFKIYDISDPTNPELIGTANPGDNVRGLYISGKYAFIGFQAGGSTLIKIYDISDPTNPKQVESNNQASGTVINMYVSGNYLYTISSYSSNNLQVWDISDISNIVNIGNATAADNAYGLDVAGKYAYVTSGSTGDDLEVFDISDPTNPTKVGGVEFGGSSYSQTIKVVGKYAYIGNTLTGELMTYDISGSDLPAATIGTVSATTADVSNNMHVGNDLVVDNALIVGQGLMVDGPASLGINASLVVDEAGLMNLTGNLHVEGCIKYNCSQPTGCVTLGVCI
ncbi:hypothetical protein KY330_01260 [Candidatus Woesearchaeota archaeon]|nr:hypothetical protein [Candidatus Woesearchaeota archaeon]